MQIRGTKKVLSDDPKQFQITSFFRKQIQNSRSDTVNNKDRQEGHKYQAIVQNLLEKANKALNIDKAKEFDERLLSIFSRSYKSYSLQQKKFAIELVRYRYEYCRYIKRTVDP